MPTVVNGIGTWYYGKSHIHRHKDVCRFCNRVGELVSYDTTLYFVVFFIPVFPLSKKRILEQCPTCSKHRVMSLKQWEAAKETDVAAMLDRLREDPDDRDTIRAALGLATAYQDEVLFDKLASTLAEHRKDDAAIQAQLGSAYAYFARWPEAEAAYRASLAVEDNPAVRRQLALALLKQSRPDEAETLVQDVLAEKLADHAGLVYLVVEGYQAQGMHREALELMDRRDAAFPQFAQTKDYKKQRKLSQKYQNSGKRVRSNYLTESKKVGYQEGGWRAKLPRFIPPILLGGALLAYLGSALWIGQARQVYLLNGTLKPYRVSLNGAERTLAPGAPTAVRVPEGSVVVESRDLDLPPTPAAVETPFWTRPFKRHTFVINPDQVAVLVKEETIYSEVPQAGPPPEIHLGRLVYAFDGLDYEFQEFPPSIKAEKGHVVHKTRVALAPGMTPNQRLQLVEATAGAKEQVEYAKHWLAGNPGDDLFLYWLTTKLSPDEMIALVTPRLAARPPLVNWHRVYQTMMEQAHPKEDLRPRYRELVAEQKGNPDAFYLLARLEDLDEGEKLLQQAAAADPPSAHAVRSLGYRALAAGQFDEAVRLLERAVRLAPGNDFTQQEYRSALLAAGRYDRLLEELAARGQGAPSLTVAIERIRTLAAKGDRKGARAAIDQTVTSFTAGNPAGQEMVRASLEAFLSCALGDVPGFLKAAGNVPGLPAFEPALLEGKLDEAAGKIEDPRAPAAGIDHGLLYLAARKANNGPLAETQWQAVLAALQGGDREAKEIGDVFAGRRPLDVDRLRRLPVDVQLKRVWLAIAAQRFPQRAKELVTLARKLDFQRDPTSLCLRRVLP